MMRWFGIMLMAALLAMAPDYGRAQSAAPKAPPPAAQPQSPEVKAEPAGTVKSVSPEDKKAYEEKTAEELDAIQSKIVDLRIKATTGAAQRKRMRMKMAHNLQVQKLAAGDQLTVLQKASETTWSQEKANLDKAMESLRKACKEAEVYLK